MQTYRAGFKQAIFAADGSVAMAALESMQDTKPAGVQGSKLLVAMAALL